MKPSELYTREPEKVVQPFAQDSKYGPEFQMEYLVGSRYNHIGSEEMYTWDIESINRSTRVEVKVYKDFDFDGRRFWRLASVWFDRSPVMIVQNAGREGDDYVGRIITDGERYGAMVTHIHSLIQYKQGEEFNGDIRSPDEDFTDVDAFYGNSLDGYFERYINVRNKLEIYCHRK